MPNYSHLYRRGAAYWFRRRVPTELLGVLGRKEWKESLGTKELEEAKRRVRQRAIETDREIAAARAKAAAEASPPLTPAEARALAEARLARWLANDEEARLLRGRKAHAATDTMLEDLTAEWREAKAHGDWQAEAATAADVLAEAGRYYPEGDQSVRMVAAELLRARVLLLDGLERRQGGEVVDTPTPSPVAAAPAAAPGVTLGHLIDAYRAEREKQFGEESTARKYGHIFKALESALGRDRPIRAITRADCRAVRDLLARMPAHMGKRFPGLTIEQAIAAGEKDGVAAISPGTLGSYLNNLSAVFNWAVEEEWLEKNPAKGLGGKGAPSVRRRGFTEAELSTLFDALLKEGADRASRFWLPALALYSGARAGELAQLLVGDIKQVDGVWCMDLSVFDTRGRRMSDKSLKTDASARVVPIHPAVLNAGFIRFVRSCGKPGDRLFPDIRKSQGSWTQDFSKWWGRFLDRIGMTQPDLTFHGFRHGFRDAGRRARVERETVEALGGWASVGQSSGYGNRGDVRLLSEELRKIGYWKFRLPRMATGEEAKET